MHGLLYPLEMCPRVRTHMSAISQISSRWECPYSPAPSLSTASADTRCADHADRYRLRHNGHGTGGGQGGAHTRCVL